MYELCQLDSRLQSWPTPLRPPPLRPEPMAPKAAAPKRRLGKKAKVAEGESPHRESAASSKSKKVKREPFSDEEQKGKHAIAGKQGLDKMYQVMKYMDKKGNPNPLALYSELKTRTEKQHLYSKYLKDTKVDWVKMEERREASNSTDNTAVEGWATRFQVAHHEKLPVDHPLMVSKLASLPSHAHPQQEWRDAGEMEYYYKGNTKTVSDL